MAITRTFSIIKPDATRRNLTGAVTKMLEEAGLRVVASKRIRMSREQAEGFYAVHKERPFFGELCDFMISGPVVVQVLEGEDAGLCVVASKCIHMTLEQAEGFYGVHRERPFFGELCDFMTSGPVVVQVLEGEDAVKRNRDVMGATNSENADEGTIRKTFAESIEANSVHGSDSDENAKIEIDYFFKPDEIVG